MRSVELEEFIQKITDQVLAELDLKEQSVEFNAKRESYPKWAIDKISSSFKCQLNAKQDSDAILLCLSKLTLTDVLAISNLIGIDDTSKRVLDYLYKGLPVWIISNEQNYITNNQRYAVRKNISEALNKLEQYGILFIHTEKELSENISALKKKYSIRVPKHFITLEEVQRRSYKGEHLLNINEVPTDLAKEWISERGEKA